MGVKDLLKDLRVRCRKAIRPFNVEEHHGAVGAADAAGLMYVTIWQREPGDESKFLRGFVDRWREKQRQGVAMVYVFDGRFNPKKVAENALRTVAKEKALESAGKKATALLQKAADLVRQADETEDIERSLQLSEQAACMHKEATKVADCPTARVSRRHYLALKKLLVEEQIPFVTALTEAEKCCAWLQKQGLVDLVMTDDSDALAYGAPVVYFNPWVSERNASRPKQIFTLATVLDELHLSQDEFAQLCALLDNDFNAKGRRLDGMSFDKAFRLLRGYHSVEAWRESPSFRTYISDPKVKNLAAWDFMGPYLEYTDPAPQLDLVDYDPEAPAYCLANMPPRLAAYLQDPCRDTPRDSTASTVPSLLETPDTPPSLETPTAPLFPAAATADSEDELDETEPNGFVPQMVRRDPRAQFLVSKPAPLPPWGVWGEPPSEILPTTSGPASSSISEEPTDAFRHDERPHSSDPNSSAEEEDSPVLGRRRKKAKLDQPAPSTPQSTEANEVLQNASEKVSWLITDHALRWMNQVLEECTLLEEIPDRAKTTDLLP